MRELVTFRCPAHGSGVQPSIEGSKLMCSQGCDFPVQNGIARFVTADNYASSFGLQWNAFQKTQLDSYTGTSISRDRLRRISGGDLEIFRDKLVLEAGCGAGRFTEIMLAHGALVFTTDLSNAVEANFSNCNAYPNYQVCQADIAALPVPPGQFDIVVCVGVIQHTPDPEKTMAALCGYLRSGGLLLIDHYSPGYPMTPSRRALRNFLLKRSSAFAFRFSARLVAALWRLHELSAALHGVPLAGRFRAWILRWSPVVDYQDAYPQLGPKLLREWAVLDTHDLLTDRFKHLRTAEQIHVHLSANGMEAIETRYAGNGVEVRARKGGTAAPRALPD